MLTLFQKRENDNDKEEGALCLENTEIIIVDCHKDQKKCTVCLMNDTPHDLMQFIQGRRCFSDEATQNHQVWNVLT